MEDELDKIIMNMVSAGESEDNIALVINSYNSEKKKSGATATPPNSASGTPTGSSGGKGFPKIDTNSIAPGLGVQPKGPVQKSNTKSTIVNLEKPKEDTSFFDYLKENLDTGLATISKSIYDAPGFIYDAAASVTNPVFRAMGVDEDKLASSDKLASDLGFKNIPSDILKEKIKVSNEKINAYAVKNGGDAFAALENGNYTGAAKLVAGTTVQSLPIMVAAMASGGQTTALTAIGLSTASTKNAELKESNPEMGLGTRVANATNSGIIEAVTGHLFTGASGAVMKKILTEKGVEQGSKIIGKSLKSTIEKSIEKNPFVGALGEIVEESAVEFGNQLNDMSSGIRTEFDVHAIKNAGLSATGMGGIQTLGVYGAKGYVKAKDYAKLKATNKEVFKLRGEIANGNLSDENKALLTLRADRLEAGNKKLLGTEIEKVKALPAELKTELNALNVEFESLKSKFDDIDDADDIPDNLKPAMKEEIKIQASLNQKRKTEILSQNDGLVVDNDFSNFNGVDPDFDLENGKISSLPLKEQDRLNKLAVEQITGGDKTIEYTKEQVSKTANEIYKNEQTSTTSQTKPQAEVQKPSEAEKVDESNNSQISNPTDSSALTEKPIENPEASQIKEQTEGVSKAVAKEPKIVVHATADSNGFSLNYNEGVNTENVPKANDPRSHQDMNTQIELNKGNSVIDKEVVNQEGDKEISILAPMTDFTGRSGGSVYDFTIDKSSKATAEGIKEIIQNSHKFSDSKGKELINETVNAVKDYLKQNEAVQKANTQVAGVSPVPSVSEAEEVSTVVENPLPSQKETEVASTDKTFKLRDKNKFYHASPSKRNGRLKVSNAPQFGNGVYFSTDKDLVEGEFGGDNTTEVSLRIEKPVYANTKEWNEVESLAIEMADKDYGAKNELTLGEDDTYFRYDKDNLSEVAEIPSKFISEAAKSLGYDAIIDEGSTQYTDEIVVLDESKIIYPEDEAASPTNTPTDGNVRPTANNVGENGITKSETPIAESVPSSVDGGENKGDAEVSDLDHAKSQIDKGVLNWNGDTGAERVNLGITWADIRKGEKDIKAGKVDTVPAKRLIEALKTAKENGGYEYKQGSGGQIQKQFVSLEDIQRSNNEYELTDAEQKEVDTLEVELSKEYESYFEALDLQSQNDIYENKEGVNGLGEEPTTSGESKNDVPNQEIEQNSGAKEKIDPKEADNDFKSKSGKKSLLNRAVEGGNSQIITDAIEANGLDYKIDNREEAKKRAEDFVNEVGTANALEAVRSNQIKGAEKAFVYSTIVDNLMNEIENATNESDKQELEKIHADLIADLTNEFSQEGTDAGRFISALNDIYNSSTLKYNLSKQIESHKAANKGEISDEVLAKFTEADKRIKELEKLIKEAEAKAKVAEDELAVKNVQEDIERKKQLANKNRSGLTPKEQTRKKELKNKFFGRLNDATSMITMLADPDFREYLGLTFKQAKGDLANFSKRIINELGKGAQAHLPQLFDEAQKSAPTKNNTIKIGKDGKIKIPAQLLRDYVEAGENDIDVIAAKIKEDIADEFPDADVRDIRDALTGYGKQINPTKDDVSSEIARLKSLGKLISAYEDASNGENPLKSGLKRAKPTQEMRELRKEINRIIKENGLDAVDLEKQWASALDKIKSQLTNQIEDLDKQIANGEKRKVERTATPLDAEATALKEIRDAKKQILDDLVGKPELTEEQLIARAEKSLEGAIDKLQNEIAQGQIAYKEKPTTKQSLKLEELRKKRAELVETRNQMREQAGLVEAQRMNVAKKRVRKQIEDLNQRIADKDYSKKVVKPLIEDTELSQLRAEKLRQQEVYDAQKYKDELENRTAFEKWRDSVLELWNVERIIRATGELSTVLIQGGMLTVSRKFTNPKALGKIMKELFTSLGSAKKSERLEGLIKVHPDYLLSQKAKLALANPDYKNDVREEQFTGDYANAIWDIPLLFSKINPKFKEFFKKERSVLGDVILNPFKKLTGIGTVGTDKINIANQWKNSNPFRVLERGSTLYMNTLRMEEFVRGCEMLRMEGKNEIDHLADYKLLANAINSMTGRANLPMEVATSSKALAVIFFSARNAVSVVNQVNPLYYGYLHFGSTDGFQMKKTSVANKLAVTNFMRFVTITGAMILAIKAGAGEDEEGEDIVQVETDPRSSDFMKIKIGNIRFDPWHGMTGPVVLMAKVLTEEVKNINSGKIEKLEDKAFGDKNRLDLLTRFGRNKFSPSMARIANTLSTNAGIDPETGEAIRVTPFGENYEVEGSFANVKPMYWDAVAEIRKENPGALAEFLTVVSTFGWNTSVYAKKVKNATEDKFLKDQAKKKALFELPESEKNKIRVENKLSPKESEIRRYQALKTAKEKGLPYYHSMDVVLTKEEVAAIDFNGSDKEIAEALKQIEKAKKEYGIDDEE